MENMQTRLKNHMTAICEAAIRESLPDAAVMRALGRIDLTGDGRVIVISIGKAGWQMANAAGFALGARISKGIVITKYDHAHGDIPGFEIYEAGHPVPDENSVRAAEAAIHAVEGLRENDRVLLLLSGGGSALFEKPLVSLQTLTSVTQDLLASGADIVAMNIIRKRLSAVKGGRFGQMCRPASVFSVILSDIIGDPPDMIASGPAYPDGSTAEQAFDIVEKYGLHFFGEVLKALNNPLPAELNHVTTLITGGVRQFTETVAGLCREQGFETTVLTDSMNCEAKEAGSFLAAIARYYRDTDVPMAFVAGGETVVQLTGKGKGGRNQEVALAAAEGIDGCGNVLVFSLASDGTDGPTDAAGGYADGHTKAALNEAGVKIHEVLKANDAYNALKKCGGLLKTGPTGTNVNDVAVILILPA